eukprot:gnl/Hemi2/5365_TR1856_c0_g1_i1.p2 gnl/Hemi2/5365_TR1856_c0_g1~~gnl/Hemi2/5365_TR1856_c0_g1_i1.p2  ORF type:complete len:333 (+),score=68.58 gnl/Hemi2/5365_TR1856_c0_g1_i1:1379-2377(+)
MYTMWATLKTALAQLLSFTLIFFVVFLGFATMAHILFGEVHPGYRDFTTSVSSSFQLLLGTFDYESIYQINRVLAPVYFFLYILLVYLILVNVFLAIVAEAYNRVTEEGFAELSDSKETNLFDGLSENVIKPIRAFLRFLHCPACIVKPRKDDNLLTDSEIYERLIKSSFVDSCEAVSLHEFKLALGKDVTDQEAWLIMCRYDPSKINEFYQHKIKQMTTESSETGNSDKLLAVTARLLLLDEEAITSETSRAHMAAGVATPEDYMRIMAEQQEKIDKISRLLDALSMRAESAILAQRERGALLPSSRRISIAAGHDDDPELPNSESVPLVG